MPTSPEPREDNIRSIDQLLRSRWAQLARDPEVRRKIPAMLRQVLERVPSSHPVVKRIRFALRLFEQESAGGLVNSRNLIILSAALLYTFWPVDAIPDLLPLVGWLDDAGLLTLVLAALADNLHQRGTRRNGNETPQDEAPPAAACGSGGRTHTR